MNTSELLEKAVIDSSMFLFECTGSKNLGDIWFCDDSAAQETTIRNSDLISPGNAESFLGGLLEGGPSWIHIDIIKNLEFSVLAMRTGRKVGNPNPAINISLSLRRVVIVE